MRYSDHANPDLLDRIPLSAGHVLDVGCGTAALALEYRRRNPRAVLTGIETDKEAIALARPRLDRLIEADLDRQPLAFAPTMPAGGYDVMIYGDILEHLHDPWAVLREQVRGLSADGTVLICAPNIEHWSFAERLLRGTWSYEETGLFDRTHLRWFNVETMRLAIAEAGLHIVDIVPRRFDTPAAEAFVAAIAPALERLGIEPASYAARATPLQHIWRARRRTTTMLAIASTSLVPVGGVSDVRVVEPMRALASEPGLAPLSVALPDTPTLPRELARVLVLHRPLLVGEPGLQSLRGILRQGWVTICEFDDNPDMFPETRRPDFYNFSGVHAVQTSTEPLAEVLRAKNPEVAVFSNAIARLPEPRNHLNPATLSLFFGGLNREQDWPAVLPGLNGAAARAGDRLKFVIVNDRALFDALETPHKEFHPLCDYETYKTLLAGCEISFMPLADTAFNRCKSDLKFLEAAAHRVVALASPVVYAQSLEDGRTGLLFQDAEQLQQRLLRLVASPEIARGMADAARSYVATHRMLAYQVSRRAAWYRSLWQRRDPLHAALLRRVPELAGALTDA